MSKNCFHCGEKVPASLKLFVTIENKPREMCCYGCYAVAKQVIETGLSNYYKHRTEFPKTPDEFVPETLKKLKLFNNPHIQSEFVIKNDDTSKEAKLIIEGIKCPACVWLLESCLTNIKGVNKADVNYSTQRCYVNWDEHNIALSEILSSINKLGYKALPYNHKRREELYDKERKQQLLRIAIASLFGVQVMMIAIALYFGEYSGIEEHYKSFFEWISLILTLPVLLFSGRVLYQGALLDIKNKRLGMDVPITLGISIALIGSIQATIQQNGHIYYDSVVMFVLFILTGRYFEFMSRKKSIAHLDKVSSLIPIYATKLTKNNKTKVVELNSLKINDKIIVKPGEIIPVDGMIIDGQSSVNESIITGESLPISKSIGANVIGGSTNVESPLYIKVKKIGSRTILAKISRLVDKTGMHKTKHHLLADKIVPIFTASVLFVATLTAIYWYINNSENWLAYTVSVLVVSCPCALSLATPTAISSAATTLMQHGIAIINTNTIEKIHKISCFVFDKTGTLTEGKLELKNVDIYQTKFSENKILSIAKSLESASEHPLAKAIDKATKDIDILKIKNIKNFPGEGVSGLINKQTWYIGTESFIKKHCRHINKTYYDDKNTPLKRVLLANDNKIFACFYFTDPIRSDSKKLIDKLKQRQQKIILMSGDHNSIVKETASKLGIDEYMAELKPEDKLENISALQKQGEIVCIIGDGINDAPAFAKADVAIAMSEASDLTKLNADLLLLNHKIETLVPILMILNKTYQVLHINFAWAIIYNVVALPLAVLGFLAPWMAAIGMTLSSLAVIINASKIATTNYK